MTRSLALLARKNKEAHSHLAGGDLNFQCMDDGSIVSYDTSIAQSRRNLLAAARMEMAPLPATSAHTPSTPRSSSLFASIARKVSSRISFRESNNNNDKSELAMAAQAVKNRNDRESSDQATMDEMTAETDHPLASHLQESRVRRKGLSPPSIMADDATISTRQRKDSEEEVPKQRRSQSLPNTKRRGRRSDSIASTRSRRSDDNDSARRPSSGSKNSSSGGDSDSKGRRKPRKSQSRCRNHENENENLSTSLSNLDHGGGTLDGPDEDEDDNTREPTKKIKRRVVVKVRSTKVDVDNSYRGDAESVANNEELIRGALKHVGSRKIDQLLQSKSKPRRRGSNGAQSCVELRTTSRESLMAISSPSPSKSPAKVKLSPTRNSTSASAPSIKISKTCLDRPERSTTLTCSREEIDAPAGLLQQPQYTSPVRPLRRSRSKSTSEKEVDRGSSVPRRKERHSSRMDSPKNIPSPTISPAKSDSSRSPSSGNIKNVSPKDSGSRRDRRRSSKLSTITHLHLDDDDDLLGESRKKFERNIGTGATRFKSEMESTPTTLKKIVRDAAEEAKPARSPKSGSRHTQLSSSASVQTKRPKSSSSRLVEELRKEMSESNKKAREYLGNPSARERSASQTPRSRPRRTLDLENSFPNSMERLHAPDEVSVTESVGTATGTPRVVRRKRVSTRSPGSAALVRSDSEPSRALRDNSRNTSGDAECNATVLRHRSRGSKTQEPALSDLTVSKGDDAPSSSHDPSAASETEATDMDLNSGDNGFGTKISYEMDDYEGEDIITLKPTGSKSKPVVAAQLQLPGLSSSVLHGDEVSVQYEDVVAYNGDSNTF